MYWDLKFVSNLSISLAYCRMMRMQIGPLLAVDYLSKVLCSFGSQVAQLPLMTQCLVKGLILTTPERNSLLGPQPQASSQIFLRAD